MKRQNQMGSRYAKREARIPVKVVKPRDDARGGMLGSRVPDVTWMRRNMTRYAGARCAGARAAALARSIINHSARTG